MQYAETAQGRRVPVLDYTRAEFRHRAPSVIQNLGSLAVLRALKWTPPAGRRWLSRRSDVLRNLLQRENNHFSGPATYLAKLGPRVPHATALDRMAAGSVQSIESARRGYSVAYFESEVLARALASSPVPDALHLINIGGGPASDSLNTLLLLRENHPEAFRELTRLPVAVHVLDSDPEGIVLGRNCLAALQAGDGRLSGLAVTLDRVAYDWEKPEALNEVLSGISRPVLVSAEGSLFEYGSDEIVLGHLRRLRATCGSAVAIVGSAFRAWSDISLVAERLNGLSPQMGWRFRGIEGMRMLAEQSGWSMERTDTGNSIYVTFVLRPR